jgi:hypothetical protein
MPAARRRTELGLLAALAALALGVVFAHGGRAAPGDPQLALVGRFVSPVYLTSPPGDRDRLFVVEQPGRILISRGGSTLPTPFLDLRSIVSFGGERGLLSMAFPPDYATSGRFYVYFTARSPSGAITVAEYRRSAAADVADPNSRRVVLSIPHSRSNHNGGQLQFGPDGFLYVGRGDGGGAGDPDRAAQNLGSLLGKLLRIDPRVSGAAAYTVPASNPFVGVANARPEIWSYGLRNPWRFTFDRQTGDLAIGDVGQGSWEEIDYAPTSSGRGRGANFGWSCFEGRHAYSPNAGESQCNPIRGTHVRPVAEYPHSRGCSITGGYVVRDPGLTAIAGRYVYGDYCTRPLWSLRLGTPDAQDDRRLGLDVPGLSSFGEDTCGRVYAVSGDGPVYRLQPAGGATSACLSARPPLKRCRVPRVIGLRLKTAKTRIRRANCRVGRVRSKRSARRRGRVISQSPRAGARRPQGARVQLTLSRGRR